MSSTDNISHIDLLPPELIAETLLCCLRECPPETRLSPGNPPWTFGKISRRWRSIALNTPALWTDLPHLTTKTRNQSYRRLLGTALKLSKPLPISINLTASLSGPDPTPPDMPLLHDILPHLHRCWDLSLSINPFAVHELSNMSVPFDNLTNLSLHFFGRDGDWDGVTDHLRFAAPKLDSLTILSDVYLGGWVFIDIPSPFMFQWFNVPWAGLTTFVASYVSVDFACEVLKNAPSLRELSLEGLYHSGAELPSEPMSVTEYPLHTLFLLNSTSDASGDAMTRSFAAVTFLSSLKLPQLKHLRFDYTPRLDNDPVTDLIQRSDCILTAVHVHISHYWTIEEVKRFFEIIPHVQDLTIRPPQDYTDAQLVLRLEDEEDCDAPLLPELRNLTIVSSQITAQGIHELIDSRTRPSSFADSCSVQPLETVSVCIPRESVYCRVYEMLNNHLSNPQQGDDPIHDHLIMAAKSIELINNILTQMRDGAQMLNYSVLQNDLLPFIDSDTLTLVHPRHIMTSNIFENLQNTSSILSSPVFHGTDTPQILKPKVDHVLAEWAKALENYVPSQGWQHVTPEAVYSMRFETMCKRTTPAMEQVPMMSYALEKAMTRREKEAGRQRQQAQRPDIQRQGSTLYF
ncbi:hypothetical protein D9619_006259 [Psilocybe cf. subviscida]|uniref:F-box domain-containing protein n=1 Tax=Psilocybe cf. subviscida TaxID=2480587 RepID=A0A8H5EXS7_9AGAR|nr:hypothetical protein D9619_006259 [Psilocybe cf. subviscida]